MILRFPETGVLKRLEQRVFFSGILLGGTKSDYYNVIDRDYNMGSGFSIKTMTFMDFRNVVVSHKALIEQELEAQRKEIISKLEKGQILEGTVKNITSYGVFVDLGVNQGHGRVGSRSGSITGRLSSGRDYGSP